MAEHRTGRGARSGRRGRADRLAPQKAATSATHFSPMERETCGSSSPAGADASLGKIRLADRANFHLDRKRSLGHHEGQAGRQTARRTDRRLQRRKDRGMGEEASEEEPQASRDGNK